MGEIMVMVVAMATETTAKVTKPAIDVQHEKHGVIVRMSGTNGYGATLREAFCDLVRKLTKGKWFRSANKV